MNKKIVLLTLLVLQNVCMQAISFFNESSEPLEYIIVGKGLDANKPDEGVEEESFTIRNTLAPGQEHRPVPGLNKWTHVTITGLTFPSDNLGIMVRSMVYEYNKHAAAFDDTQISDDLRGIEIKKKSPGFLTVRHKINRSDSSDVPSEKYMKPLNPKKATASPIDAGDKKEAVEAATSSERSRPAGSTVPATSARD